MKQSREQLSTVGEAAPFHTASPGEFREGKHLLFAKG